MVSVLETRMLVMQYVQAMSALSHGLPISSSLQITRAVLLLGSLILAHTTVGCMTSQQQSCILCIWVLKAY